VGDLYFDLLPRSQSLFYVLFGTTTALGVIYTGIVLRLTRRDVHISQPDTPLALVLLKRHWPGPVVLVALAIGVCFVATTVFLTRQATALGLVGVRTYFTGYALSAFTFRVLSRTWSRSLGRHRMILIGLVGHIIGQLLLIRVTHEWDFVLPSLCGGFGHALLFPCVVSLGAERFPPQYRGTGTTLILGFIDVGMALAAQPLGWVLDHYGFTEMYLGTTAFCFVTLAYYGLRMANAADADRDQLPAATEVRQTPNVDALAEESSASNVLLPVSAQPR
jgi:MFS family permease